MATVPSRDVLCLLLIPFVLNINNTHGNIWYKSCDLLKQVGLPLPSKLFVYETKEQSKPPLPILLNVAILKGNKKKVLSNVLMVKIT